MASSPFQIPGNIKQQFLPFVLNPNAKLNSSVQMSNLLKYAKADPQVFSFRTNLPHMWSGTGKLNICPSSFEKFMNKDISNQMLFSKDNKGKSVTFGDVYNSLPKIQIREFLPDTRLDQALNMFGDLVGKLMELLNSAKKGQDTTNQQVSTDTSSKGGFFENFSLEKITDKIKDLGSDFKNTIIHAFNYLTGVTQPNNFYMKGSKSRFTGYDESLFVNDGMIGTYVMSFPWMMYYKLQSSVTTNIYEVPYKSNNLLLTSDGSSGWKDGGEFAINNATSKIPLIGGLLNKIMEQAPGLNILQNIRVNYMPYWNSKDGAQTGHPAIEITFDLFNDTDIASMINFIFVNTIVPNNRWIQYNIFQHSPCLYDVKIEGLNRFYACTGKFDVTYQGVLRDPPDSWIDKLISSHGNKMLNVTAKDFIKKQKIIKIPDVYQIKMTFQPMLPNNFNNFIYSYSQNINSLETYYTNVYDESQMTKATVEPRIDFFNEMKDYIVNGRYNDDNETTKAQI